MTTELDHIVNTSVQDMSSSLECSFKNGTLKQKALLDALLIVEKRGEKSKALIIERYLKKVVKAEAKICLFRQHQKGN